MTRRWVALGALVLFGCEVVHSGLASRGPGGADTGTDARPDATSDGCVARAEECNGLDDNCNGFIDDLEDEVCGASDVGVCRLGTRACESGFWGECVGAVLPGPVDLCDSPEDEDCDTRIDEECGCTGRETRPCGTSEGICEPGIRTCMSGTLGPCVGEMGPRTEICNGLDDDCNGMADDALTFTTYFRDLDGDTWGDDTVVMTGCAEPEGYVVRPGDCDDSDERIHPGVVDTVCDGVDSDCDGPEELEPYYLDSDGDTYGDPRVEMVACARPVGFVANSDDCDDDDENRNPGLAEVCDGFDNDCVDGVDNGVCLDECERHEFSGSTYQFCSVSGGWWRARGNADLGCRGGGYELVRIDSEAEQDFVFGIAEGNDHWIGLNSTAGDMSLRWAGRGVYDADGYTRIQATLDDGERCFVMEGTTGEWQDRTCTQTVSAFICEVPR